MLDRDLSAATAETHPEVYVSGRLNLNLNMQKMLSWIANAVVHSCIIFWLPALYASGTWDADGTGDGLLVVGTTVYTGMIMAMHARVVLETSTWTRVHVAFLGVSILCYYLFLVGYSHLPAYAPEFAGVGTRMLSQPVHWFSVLLVTVACFAFDLAVEFSRLQFAPDMIDVAIERDRLRIPWPSSAASAKRAAMSRLASYRQFGTSKIVVGLADMKNAVGPLTSEQQQHMGVRDTSDPRYMASGFAFSSAEHGSEGITGGPMQRPRSVGHGMRLSVLSASGGSTASAASVLSRARASTEEQKVASDGSA